MRPFASVAILGTTAFAIACLLVGVAGGAVCAPGMATAACLGGSASSIRDVLGATAATGVIAGGLLVASTLWEVRRHGRLSSILDRAASPAWLADQEVRLVPGLDAPYVAGLAHPRIYCPADLAERLSGSELRAVLLHERHHQLAHASVRLVLLAALVPAIGHLGAGRRWVERRRAAIEIAADEHAIEAGAGRPDLARALLKLGSASLDVSLPSYASASELRLRHLTAETIPTSRGLGSVAPAVLPVVAFAACLVWAVIA